MLTVRGPGKRVWKKALFKEKGERVREIGGKRKLVLLPQCDDCHLR